MLLHERTLLVQRARSAAESALLACAEYKELTITERMIVLNEIAAYELRYALRIERHGDASKKADEE